MIVLLLFCVLMIGIFYSFDVVSAEEEDDKDSWSGKEKFRVRDLEGREKEVEIEVKRENGKVKRRIRVDGDGDFEAESELEIEIEDGEIKVRMKNGDKKRVRVMPDEVAVLAIQELGSEDFEIKLEEEDGEVIYSIETEKEGRFLGIFKMKMKIRGRIDPETGEFIGKKKPWWAFLVGGEDDDQFSGNKKVTICHIPPGNPENAHTNSIGAPALRAHLAHGDTLGACDGGGRWQ